MSAHPPSQSGFGATGSHGDLVNEDVHHEESDINVRAILWFVAILTGITVAIQIAMWGMFKGLAWYEVRNEPYVTPLTRQPAQASDFPEPRLQTTPWTEMQAFRAEQDAYLHSYGWVDEKLGIARIPIAKAKALLLQRGVAVRPELAADLDGTSLAATGDASGGRSLPGGQADKSGGGGGFVSPDAAVTPEPPAPAPPRKPGGGA